MDISILQILCQFHEKEKDAPHIRDENVQDRDKTGTRWPESHPFWLQLEARYLQSTASRFSEIDDKSVVPVPQCRIIQNCKSADLQGIEHQTQRQGSVGGKTA